MKLTTIWTLPAATLQEKLHRTHEWLAQAIAHRLPRSIAYWSYIDTGVRHMQGDEIVPEVRYTEILERASKGRS